METKELLLSILKIKQQAYFENLKTQTPEELKIDHEIIKVLQK